MTLVSIQDASKWLTEQLTLGAYRQSDPETSRDAAVDAANNAATLRSRCYDLLKGAGAHGLTDFELVDVYQRRYQRPAQQTSLGKRRGELRDAGLVEACKTADGSLVKRPSPSGSAAIVWKAVGS